MKRILMALGASTLLLGGTLGISRQASAAHSTAAMKPTLQLIAPNGPVTVRPNGKITIDVAATGFTFAPMSVGKAAMPGMGHGHFYVDRMPAGGYSSAAVAANPRNGWAGAFTSNMAVFDLTAARKLGINLSPGQHLLIIALAKNNHVLYRAPAAVIPFVVR